MTRPDATEADATLLRVRSARPVQDGLLVQMSAARAENRHTALEDHTTNVPPTPAASLAQAAERGDAGAVAALLLAGASAGQTSQDGITVLMLAALFGRADVIRTLVSAGAEVDQTWLQDGSTALAHAAANGQAAAVLALIQWGADVNHADSKGRTALDAAARNDHHHIISLLIRAGSFVDQADHDGLTALMGAAACSCQRSVHALLEAGANCRLQSRTGTTALSYALARKNEQIVKLLRAHGATA